MSESQKNGAIVRKTVGHDRLVGEQAYRQLRELYRAVRLYVNCFQPRVLLLSKHREGENVRRVYDAAKTPWQWLMLSGVLPATTQQHLCEVVQALDPLRLLSHLKHLQQALWRCARSISPLTHSAPAASLLRFCVQGCMQGPLPAEEKTPAPTSVLHRLQGEAPGDTGLLDWSRTSRDPFEGQWELILSLVLIYPEWSGSDLFQEVQRLFPGHYRPSHQHTLQSGLRKIRACLLILMEEPWPQEVIQGGFPALVSHGSDQREAEADRQAYAFHAASASLPVRSSQEQGARRPVHPKSTAEEAIRSAAVSAPLATQPDGEQPNAEPDQTLHHLGASLPQAGDQEALLVRRPTLSIEGAIQSYLQEQRANGRRPKTMEWHRTASGLFQQYLVSEHHLSLLWQITESEVRGWVAFLRTTPSSKDTARSASTIATYARSARAFCHWLVRNRHLEQTPIIRGTMPKAGRKIIHVIEPDEFERLLLACRAGGESDASVQRAVACNRAILWVLLDTGMRVSELCGLCLSDVDREQRALRVQRTEGKERWLMLSPHGWFQLLSYLEQYRPKEGCSEGERVEEDHLFLSQWYQPLTVNGITLLFDRLKKRAGMTEKPVSPSVLRDTFAARYLQAGGELEALSDILGLADVAALKHYVCLSAHKTENELRKEPAEEHQSSLMAASQKSRQRRRRSPSAATRNQQQRGAGSSLLLMVLPGRGLSPVQKMTHE